MVGLILATGLVVAGFCPQFATGNNDLKNVSRTHEYAPKAHNTVYPGLGRAWSWTVRQLTTYVGAGTYITDPPTTPHPVGSGLGLGVGQGGS